MIPAGPEPFMTVAEIAELLRLSKMSVYRLIERDGLPAYKFGRSYRVDKRDVAEYVKSCATRDAA